MVDGITNRRQIMLLACFYPDINNVGLMDQLCLDLAVAIAIQVVYPEIEQIPHLVVRGIRIDDQRDLIDLRVEAQGEIAQVACRDDD